jgi:hypothetical protein
VVGRGRGGDKGGTLIRVAAVVAVVVVPVVVAGTGTGTRVVMIRYAQ